MQRLAGTLAQAFSTPKEFLTAVPASLSLVTKKRNGKVPTLKAVEVAYGEATPRQWLALRLFRLAEYAGARKPGAWELNTFADYIADKHSYLDLGEVDDFVSRVMGGEYGKFYGEVDMMALGEMFQRWLGDRHNEMVQEENERRRAERAAEPEGMTLEEYCRLKGLQPVSSIAELIATQSNNQ